VITCTLLTFALCADPNVSGAVLVGDLTVPIVWSRTELRSCLGIGLQSAGEAGLTRIESAWRSEQTDDSGGNGYSGRLLVQLQNVRIEMTAFSWDHETAADENAMRRLYQATLWHELGHVRTAEASVDALNAQPVFSAQSANDYTALAQRHGEAAGARINADQVAYDRAADHGLRQSTLPPPLAGPDTIVDCGSGRGRSR
jgi:hypothetical protein